MTIEKETFLSLKKRSNNYRVKTLFPIVQQHGTDKGPMVNERIILFFIKRIIIPPKEALIKMRCANCGEKNLADTKFCVECGRPL
jgi:hypothetical protein